VTAAPGALARAEQYFGAWNVHDPAAVAAAFAEGGTYAGPDGDGPPLTGPALADHVAATPAGFPDLRFEVPNGPFAGGADGPS
jgi:SnoaL-like domain